jgi:pimeloyl-ACP methyl ester carboxylesterase
MKKVVSSDGTPIAYDETGKGSPVILVAGAFSYRKYSGLVKLAERLSSHYTVINYDRRGRGDSGDTRPYAVDREIEDLAALLDAAGGSAYVWGLSSGAVLALRAAASGLNFKKLALYEPPFIVDDTAPKPPADFEQRLNQLVAEDQRSQAAKYFMVNGMGAPSFFVNMIRLMPSWKRLKAVAHTLPYDYAVMGDTLSGRPLSADTWSSVKMPTLVMDGKVSPPRMRQGAQALADVLPDARRLTLEKQKHEINPEAFAPVLLEFFTD